MQGLLLFIFTATITGMKFLLPILLLLNIVANAAEEGDSISAYVSAEQVKRNQTFEVGVNYTGDHRYSIELAKNDGLIFVGGPMTSQQSTFINGVGSSSGSKKYYYKADKAGRYQFAFNVSENGALVGTYTVSISVSKEEWSKEDEEAKRKQEEANNPFNSDFFSHSRPQYNYGQPQAQTAPKAKPMAKKDMAKLATFNAQFETYDVVVGKETIIRYIVRFNKVSEGQSNLPRMQLVALPAGKGVNVQMQGSSEISGGARNSDEHTQQITIAVRCIKPGKYTLSPLVIQYNGKHYKSSKLTLNTIYKGEGVEI